MKMAKDNKEIQKKDLLIKGDFFILTSEEISVIRKGLNQYMESLKDFIEDKDSAGIPKKEFKTAKRTYNRFNYMYIPLELQAKWKEQLKKYKDKTGDKRKR